MLLDHMDRETSARPVLETMVETHFIRGLSAFQNCTLVSVCHGDYIVPYASSSIRCHSSYPKVNVNNISNYQVIKEGKEIKRNDVSDHFRQTTTDQVALPITTV